MELFIAEKLRGNSDGSEFFWVSWVLAEVLNCTYRSLHLVGRLFEESVRIIVLLVLVFFIPLEHPIVELIEIYIIARIFLLGWLNRGLILLRLG